MGVISCFSLFQSTSDSGFRRKQRSLRVYCHLPDTLLSGSESWWSAPVFLWSYRRGRRTLTWSLFVWTVFPCGLSTRKVVGPGLTSLYLVVSWGLVLVLDRECSLTLRQAYLKVVLKTRSFGTSVKTSNFIIRIFFVYVYKRSLYLDLVSESIKSATIQSFYYFL